MYIQMQYYLQEEEAIEFLKNNRVPRLRHPLFILITTT